MATQIKTFREGTIHLAIDTTHKQSNPATPSSLSSIKSLWQFLQIGAESPLSLCVYQPGSTQENPIAGDFSYSTLLRSAEDRARLLSHVPGIRKHKIVLIHFDNHRQNIEWLWAVIRAGFIPAISTPFSTDIHQRNEHLHHLRNLLDDPLMLTSEHLLTQYPEMQDLTLRTVEAVAKPVHGSVNGDVLPPFGAQNVDDPALLMLTSGSTGHAKAVALTVPQVLSSVCGKSENWDTSSSSVFLNWIGLDHVANLTEIHLHAMLVGAKQVHVQANDLLSDPLLFIHFLAEHRITHTFAPNFFLALLEKNLSAAESSDPIHSVDLSSLESVMSGGEANVVQTANNVSKLFEGLGAQSQVIRLGYGLTESCAANMYGVLDPEYEASEGHEFASIGKPISGSKVRISKDDGTPAKADETGNLELSGPVIFKTYYNDPISTEKAFTADGWYITGDRAYIDSYGKVNMAGRAKEVIVINGVKHFPVDIEAAVEKASLPGVIPSYVGSFAHRSEGSATETYCVFYGSAPSEDDRIATTDAIAKIASGTIGARPKWVIPLPQDRLDKSSLGKLSRQKIQASFEKGAYDDVKVDVRSAMREIALKSRVAPTTETETKIIEVLSAMLDLPSDEVSVDRTIFELGLTSVGLFRFEQNLRKVVTIDSGVSVITFLSNPLVRSIANAIDNQHSREYNPVVQLQARGTKSPLWLVHPASGNVLAFLPLARTVKDRPLFALTARGLSNNESLFSSIEEMSDTYYRHVKATQPAGPYALTGYSLGTTVAFELAKRLEADGSTVAFCAALDSPPHVIPLVENLDWTAAAVLVSYFLELIPQDSVPGYISRFHGQPKPQLIQSILDVSRPAQRAVLNLDVQQLLAIVNVTDNFGSMAKVFHPQGAVRKVDVYYCTPLHSVEKRGRKEWIEGHLSKWQDFSRERIEFHECEGDHADMLNPTYVEGFEERLARVLAMRGI